MAKLISEHRAQLIHPVGMQQWTLLYLLISGMDDALFDREMQRAMETYRQGRR